MDKNIFLEPLWNLHIIQNQMISNPPKGFRFVTNQNSKTNKLAQAGARSQTIQRTFNFSSKILPMNLIKSWSQRNVVVPEDSLLTYAVDHLVFRKEPWIVEVEYATALVGSHPNQLKLAKHIVESRLKSPRCKRIICWSEAGRQSLINELDIREIKNKIELIYLGAIPKEFTKLYDPGPVKLLFIGSGSTTGAFEGRGAKVFDIFDQLTNDYPSLELIVRSDVPPSIKNRYSQKNKVTIYDNPVSRETLNSLLESADIFLLPAYGTLPITILEAMSYELPVVTIDSWANSEYVKDGITGFVSPRSEKILGHFPGTEQPGFLGPHYRKAIKDVDTVEIQGLVDRVRILIENPELRKTFGKAGRKEIEDGKFSFQKLNEQLRRVFTESLEDR